MPFCPALNWFTFDCKSPPWTISDSLYDISPVSSLLFCLYFLLSCSYFLVIIRTHLSIYHLKLHSSHPTHTSPHPLLLSYPKYILPCLFIHPLFPSELHPSHCQSPHHLPSISISHPAPFVLHRYFLFPSKAARLFDHEQLKKYQKSECYASRESSTYAWRLTNYC